MKSMESILDVVHYHFNLLLQRVLFAKSEVHGGHLGCSTISFQPMLQTVLLQKVKSMESISDVVHYHFNLMLQRILL